MMHMHGVDINSNGDKFEGVLPRVSWVIHISGDFYYGEGGSESQEPETGELLTVFGVEFYYFCLVLHLFRKIRFINTI